MDIGYRLEFSAFGPSQGIIYCTDLSDAKRRFQKLLRYGRTPALYKANGYTDDKKKKVKWQFMRQGEE